MKKLALLGAGDLGNQIMEYVKETGMYEIVGFFDDNEALGNMHCGLPIFGKINMVENYYKQGNFDYVFITIGYRWFDTRKKIKIELDLTDNIILLLCVVVFVWLYYQTGLVYVCFKVILLVCSMFYKRKMLISLFRR